MWFSIVTLLLVSVQVQSESHRNCGVCEPEKCVPPSEDCLTGLVKDLCGCCYVCGRREGAQCDGDTLPLPYQGRGYGPCGENLECRPRNDLPPSDPPETECVCIKKEALCGNDGKTYENECQMTEARYKYRNGLQAIHRGPCSTVAKIITPPEDVSNSTGGNVAMTCEAMGWPVPTIEWRVDRGKGDTKPLPSDDSKISVQSRGGPSKYEVTSWLQMLNVQPDDDATYWCIAKNEEGESSAAAKLIILDSKADIGRKDINNDL
ncbi:insulin-like growth factor-binding protein-related protein 1 [Parasteatoda tepidariorum]|uniref:insulin-like growth factor-binding protein-related protein 1 n=1 Tax=Parasteatoda tepidariorum TaxID=114398 RepID=UPI00077FCF4A|nr:insulin-like growth factor-binding protein-related protein 1 [Parasteatoda tepidariorum]